MSKHFCKISDIYPIQMLDIMCSFTCNLLVVVSPGPTSLPGLLFYLSEPYKSCATGISRQFFTKHHNVSKSVCAGSIWSAKALKNCQLAVRHFPSSETRLNGHTCISFWRGFFLMISNPQIISNFWDLSWITTCLGPEGNPSLCQCFNKRRTKWKLENKMER